MDELFVGRIGKSLSFRKRMHEKIPIIPLGDVPDEIGFRCESLDADIRSFSSIVDDIDIYFLFYIVLRDGYFGFKEKKGDKLYSFNRQCIS